MASAARRNVEDPVGPITMAEFMAMPEEDAYRIELVRGRIVREPRPAPLHGRLQALLAQLLLNWVDRTREGVVLTDAGFVVERDPLTIRGPDVAYVSHARLPESAYEGGFWHMGPDLAVEVLSPSNGAAEVDAKVHEYFAAGSRLIWVVDPRRRVATTHEAAGGTRVIEGTGQLDGGDVLPGLTIPLTRLFTL